MGESFILTELRGYVGETLYYADSKAAPGVTYTYRVIPVHAELLDNGILLEGVQSVQVARAQDTAPSLGQWLKNLFTSGREEDAATKDRPASMLTN